MARSDCPQIALMRKMHADNKSTYEIALRCHIHSSTARRRMLAAGIITKLEGAA